LLSVAVHPANIQDRDGIALVLSRRTRRLFPFIERIFADGGYWGPKATEAVARTGTLKIEIAKRPNTAIGFQVVPKRWIVDEPSPGSVASVALLEILSATPEPSQPLSVSPWSASCYDA